MLHSSTTAGTPAFAVEQKYELPFTVRQPTNHHELQQIASLRSQAYSRASNTLAEQLALPEDEDFQPGNVVLAAYDKESGAPLGTMRIHTNLRQPLPLEQSITLPPWVARPRMCEATRLAVRYNAPSLVKLALFKAFYQTCLKHSIDMVVVTGRDPIYRQYENLLFQEVFPGAGFMPIRHVANLPHKVLYLDIPAADHRWVSAKHPLYSFMVQIRHDDIVLPTSLNSGPVLAAGSGVFPAKLGQF